ncbi:DUF6456 domain-containing protein [Pelagibacterium lacus]|uniref:DNA replication protein n=1 Tax=Pelagibacterium lacus TaxID=2282655 RepID=A0A369W949_9HYPH|nr:DUF6456 domain-containing protein [Pelagibacterium lacus]RDE10499.1 DNA replication protein [Pelagibacterium lacus]
MGNADPAAPDLAPVMALARPQGGQPAFLAPHHLETVRIVKRLFERSHLRRHVTMHYGPRVGGTRRIGSAADIADSAAEARTRLNRLLAGLPGDCAGVVIDVCGFEKGLQEIERDRGWPRRSAKLVLRIGLDALATRLGLSPVAAGPEGGRQRGWHGAGAVPREFS